MLIDASVAFKWFHSVSEAEVGPARALLARADRRRILDLTTYEVANVLVRKVGRPAKEVREVIDLLAAYCEEVAPTGGELGRAAELAEETGLSFYDASYAAVAELRDWQLVTADRRLLSLDLGISPTEAVARLHS